MPKKESPLPPEALALFRAWAKRGETPHHGICAYCGSSYVARQPHSRYCRTTCRTRAWKQAQREAKETS